MTPDWSALGGHFPLVDRSVLYEAPPWSSGEDIADRVLAGARILLVGGPAGIGKSTELAQAVGYLRGKGDRLPFLLPIDQWENMRRITPDQLLLRIAKVVASNTVRNLNLALSPHLATALVHVGILCRWEVKDPFLLRESGLTTREMVKRLIYEVAKHSKVTLLIDGMEKVPEGDAGLELFDALAELSGSAELVVTVPWHVTYGPQSSTVIRPGEQRMILRPGRVEGDEGVHTRDFMRKLVARRIKLDPGTLEPCTLAAQAGAMASEEAPPTGFANLVDQATAWSGGIPRIMIQILAGAGTYARLRRSEGWPNQEDLADSVASLEESFQQALLPGDTDAAIQAEGTDGRELGLERKIRLLSRGILLERLDDKRIVMEIHPLARRAIMEGREHVEEVDGRPMRYLAAGGEG